MEISETLLTIFRMSRHIAVFTGAGVSAESGIPTFRDAMSGLWTQYDATQLASPEGFLKNPALVWGWYEWRRSKVLAAQPSSAHIAIAEMTRFTPHLTLITQNVDDLHERAGSMEVIHLHGSLHKPRCFDCSRPFDFPPGIPDEPEGGRSVEPPHCKHCKGYIRPGVVWFGEYLPEDAWTSAQKAVQDCDVLISVGTSSLVWPAADLPQAAARLGKAVIQINPGVTLLDEVATYNLRGKAGEVFSVLLDAIRNSS